MCALQLDMLAVLLVHGCANIDYTAIGSAAGVTLMILDRVTFTRYLRTISLPAAAGFFGGFLVFLTLNTAGLTLH